MTETAEILTVSEPRRVPLPIAGIIWLVVAVVIALVGLQTVSLRDEERFVSDVRVEADPSVDSPENTVAIKVTAGTFAYNVIAQIPVKAEPGTFTSANASGSPIAAAILENIDEVTEVSVEPSAITVTYEGELEGEQMLRRVRRFVITSVLNPAGDISGAVVEETPNTLQYTVADTFMYGLFVPALIPEGEEEVYATREAGLAGSPLAQRIFTEVNSVEALTIRRDSLLVTYREGAVQNQVVSRVQDALNAFYPRASLQTDLWLLTVRGSAERLISIIPVNTELPLWVFLALFAAIETLLFFYFRNRDEKLVRPLVRVVGVFLLSWSIFGNEPLWDYLLGQIFPNSRQLIHPSATVIQFAAQHLELVIISSLIIIPTGLIIGILVTRQSFREILPLMNNLVNSGQTVPTIAVVAIMAPIIGFGFWPAIIALFAYGLLPVVRNTIAGLEAVDAFIIDSARGMGMTPTQILFQIELPIASRVIMAGIRTSMVINVGTATLGAFVGSGGLGTPIASGLAMTVDAFILLGAIPAALLAILVDYILGRIEFVITPKGLQIAG